MQNESTSYPLSIPSRFTLFNNFTIPNELVNRAETVWSNVIPDIQAIPELCWHVISTNSDSPFLTPLGWRPIFSFQKKSVRVPDLTHLSGEPNN